MSTTISVTLDHDQLSRFTKAAELLGVSPEEAARISIQEFLNRPDDEFEAIIGEILEDHGEALRRLAR